MNIAVDMHLFDAAVALSNGGNGIQLSDLASKTGADPQLMGMLQNLRSLEICY